MGAIYGFVNLTDTDYQFVNTLGQQVSFEAATLYLNQVNAELIAAQQVFVETETENFLERYKLPGGGRLQRRGGQARSASAKASGQWDVGYPLEDFGDTLTVDDITMAYMSGAEYERHIQDVVIKDTNTVRFEMLKAMLNITPRTWIDERTPAAGVIVQPFALTSDSTVYPPVLGAETEATAQGYVGTNYLASAISDTNNPLATAVDYLESHFGENTGGEEIVTFVGSGTASQKLQLLTDFVAVPDQFIREGTNTDVPQGLPNVPGRILGRASGSWVVQWRWMPANYLLSIHLGMPGPLKRRVDPAGTGLGRGLQLVGRDIDYPLESAFWRHRFGFGVGNRLNGFAQQLVASTSYTTPTAFA